MLLLSQKLEKEVQQIMIPYGIKCINFVIASMDIDDDELRRKYDDKVIELVNKLREAKADNDIINLMGENYTRREVAKMLHEVANNASAGEIASTGAGFGMGIAATSIFANMANNFMSPVHTNSDIQVTQKTQPKPTGRFGVKADEETSASNPLQDDDIVLSQLKKWLEDGKITQSQYDTKVEEILKRI